MKKHPKEFESKSKMACTKVMVKIDVGFKNALYIRGNAPGLSWQKGKLMKNMGPDSWFWETDAPIGKDREFKVLINDQTYEDGENHKLSPGTTVQFTPRFIKVA